MSKQEIQAQEDTAMDVSVKEAAALAGRSPRQVMRWITEHKVTAHKDKLGKWRIALDSLGAVAEIANEAMDTLGQARGVTIPVLLARIEALERKVEQIDREAIRRSYMPSAGSLPAAPRPESRITPAYVPSPAYTPPVENQPSAGIGPLITMGGLPEGTITLLEMAQRHSVPDTTLKSQVKGHDDLVTGISQGATNGRQSRFATPANQRNIIAMWRAGNKPYSKCGRAECACME